MKDEGRGMIDVEGKIRSELMVKFNLADDKVRIQRERRIYVEVEYARFRDVFNYAAEKLGFVVLCTITGLDEGTNLAFIYHLSSEKGIVLNIKTSLPKENAVLKTITDRFPGAEIYERELVDLLGAKVEGLGEGNRYPLTDDWPKNEYPLRKDWKSALAKGKEAGNA